MIIIYSTYSVAYVEANVDHAQELNVSAFGELERPKPGRDCVTFFRDKVLKQVRVNRTPERFKRKKRKKEPLVNN
jgi:hypothetical protein